MANKDIHLIWEARISRATNPGLGSDGNEPGDSLKITFGDTNQKGRRIPRLITRGDDQAAIEMVGLDENGNEVAFYEVETQWSWYGSYYRQTETSPAEEPVVEDITVTQVIDKSENPEINVTDDKQLVDQIEDVIKGELEGAGASYMEALGWEIDDGY